VLVHSYALLIGLAICYAVDWIAKASARSTQLCMPRAHEFDQICSSSRETLRSAVLRWLFLLDNHGLRALAGMAGNLTEFSRCVVA